MKVYDKIKLFNYDDKLDLKIPEIIQKKSSNGAGLNKLFSYTLDKLGYKTYLGEIVTDIDSLITLVEVKDSKYNINGIYLFDPSMDNLPKEKYKKDIRGINYNFFGVNISSFNDLNYDFKFKKILSILSIDNFDYAKEKEEICKDKDSLKEKENILNKFNLSFDDLYKKMWDSKKIDVDTIININDVLYPTKQEKYNDYLKYNYNSRKDELFKKNTEEELKEYINFEKN